MGQGIFEPVFFGKVSGLVYIFRHKCSIPSRTTVTANFLVWIIWTLVFSILPSFIGFMVTKNMILNSPNVTQLCSSGYILSLLVLLPGQARSWSNYSVCQLDLAVGDWHIISFNGTHYLVEMDLRLGLIEFGIPYHLATACKFAILVGEKGSSIWMALGTWKKFFFCPFLQHVRPLNANEILVIHWY